MPKITKVIMLRHMHGYSDCFTVMFDQQFDFYQVIGCRHQAACLTPSASKDESVPYYRNYNEPRETRLYFKGFSLAELRKYVAGFNDQSECSKCAMSSPRQLVRCKRF